MTFGRAYYLQVLREYRPHLIFSVHDCLNRGYFQLARETLGERQRPLRHLLRGIFRGLGLFPQLDRAERRSVHFAHAHGERLRA